MRRGFRAVLIGAMLVTACTPSNGSQLYEPKDFFEALTIAMADITGAPPGANRWDCQPTSTHPRPVILLHGIMGNGADNMGGISPFLANNGWCVFSLNYGSDASGLFGGLWDMKLSSLTQFGPFVDKVLAATGSTQVDIVGHSEGSVMPRYWMRYGNSVTPDGKPKVHSFVGLGPASYGASLDGLAAQMQTIEPFASLLPGLDPFCGACRQLMYGSTFMRELNSDQPHPDEHFTGPVQPGVRYLMLASRFDQFLVPFRTGFIDSTQVLNETIQDHCSITRADHLSMVFDPTAFDLTANFLDPTHTRQVRCQSTEPVFPTQEQT